VKPLFIPLKSEFFYRFKSGDKKSELRLYGPRWNEKTCAVGRSVVLSKGYGKGERLTGVVEQFYKRRDDTFGSTYQADIVKCFGTVDVWIAEIRISGAAVRQ
jgi:hypothetical protein